MEEKLKEKARFLWHVSRFESKDIKEVGRIIGSVVEAKKTGNLRIDFSQGGVGNVELWEKRKIPEDQSG